MNDVITLKCIASQFSDLANSDRAENYYHSRDHEFWLNVGEYYFLLGLTTMSNVPYFYVFSKNTPLEVEIQPAVLFDLDWTKIPNDWHIKIHEKTRSIEIVPKELAETEHWFEKYLDEDEKTLQIVNNLITKMLPLETEEPQEEDPYAWPFPDDR
jgi:hypothetical protein